MDFNAKLG